MSAVLTVLLVALLAGLLLDAGCRCVSGEGGARALGGAVLATSVLLVELLALGSAGRSTAPAIALGVAAFWLIARWRGPRRRGLWPVALRLVTLARTRWLAAFLVAGVVLLLGWAIAYPQFPYDSASYHLPWTA